MSSLSEPSPVDEVRSCPHCGTDVDPLRAARVRIIGERFLYFCSSQCAEAFTPNDDSDFTEVRRSRPPLREPETTAGEESPEPPKPERPSGGQFGPPEALDRVSPKPAAAQTRVEEASATTEPVGAERLLNAAIGLALLTIGLLLAADSEVTLALRVGAVSLGSVAYLAHWAVFERHQERRLAGSSVGLSLLSLLMIGVSWALDRSQLGACVNYAATYLAVAAGTTLLLRRLFRSADEERAALARWLDQPATRVEDEQLSSVSIEQLRPGEQIVVHAGEPVVADVTVVAGNAEIYPWFGAETLARVSPGDFVYAGARLASGQLRAVVRWTGRDRHWQRLTHDPNRRADTFAPNVVLSKKLAYRSAPILALLALIAGALAQYSPIATALTVLSALGALLSPALHRVEALRVTRAVLSALNHGIVFRSASALDAAGRAALAVFCARGTLLLGEPELSNIDALGDVGQDELLSLAAGAEQTQRHPAAIALMRAARARGVVPDAVRSPRREAGLGVTAIASNGKPLVVGSRALLLRERVSVARAEARVTELEAMGRTVVLIALGNHLVGLLALQDGLRAGSRAAVQHLLDAGIEPVLLSGDARKSCESLGRTIDIEHVRPEVLPAERGKEIERLRSGGAQVAVIGRSPNDDVALGSASVSVALPTPGTPNMDYDVELATEEVQKAALALRLAQRTRSMALRGMAIGFCGAATSVLSVVALSAPAAFVPLAGFGFTLAAAATLSAESNRPRASSIP